MTDFAKHIKETAVALSRAQRDETFEGMRARIEQARLDNIAREGVSFTCASCKKEYADSQYGRGFTNGTTYCEFCSDQLEDDCGDESEGE